MVLVTFAGRQDMKVTITRDAVTVGMDNQQNEQHCQTDVLVLIFFIECY
jgi:hypothetical protein